MVVRPAFFQQRHFGDGEARALDQPAGDVLVQDAGHQGLIGNAFFQGDCLKNLSEKSEMTYLG